MYRVILPKQRKKCQSTKIQLTKSTSGRSAFIIGHTMYGGEEGHCDIKMSAYAEQNHASMKAIAGDDPIRSIEQNIINLMHRTGGRFDEL